MQYGCILEIETTSRSKSAEAIEIALIQFEYDPKRFRITEVIDSYLGHSKPQNSITKQSTAYHGIKKSDLKNKKFNLEKIETMLSESDSIFSFKEENEKKIVNTILPALKLDGKPWISIHSGIDWNRRLQLKESGLRKIHDSLGIEIFPSQKGAHREAIEDAKVLLNILGRPVFFADLLGRKIYGEIDRVVLPSQKLEYPKRDWPQKKNTPSHSSQIPVLKEPSEKKPLKKKTSTKKRRSTKTNPRSTGTNPRALGTNPRALGKPEPVTKKPQKSPSKTSPAHIEPVLPATVTSASNQLRGFLSSYKSGNAKKQALDDLASKLNASPWGTQWHPVYDYDSRLTELVKLVGPADVSAGIINGNFTLLIRQAGLDRRRSEYNRPDKLKKAVTDLRGYLRKQTGNADFYRKKAFLDFLALNLGLDWDPDWNAIDDYESRLQLFVELKGIRSIEEGIYTKKFEEIYKRYRSKPVSNNSSGKPQKDKDSPFGCMLLIGLLILIAFAISR